MKKIFVLLCLSVAGSLFAFDRDFTATGSGKNAPRQLQVFRRGKAYIVVLDSAKPSIVTAQKDGREIFALSTEKADHRIERRGNMTVWVLPDSVTGLRDNDLIEVKSAFTGSRTTLPDASGGALRVSGRKGNAYSWNDENGTILEQVDNHSVSFSDVVYDVTGKLCGDLVSGKAEIKADVLELTAVLRENGNCNMRVWIDSVPEQGYSGDGTDFMLDDAYLSCHTGKDQNHWSWKRLKKVEFKKTPLTAVWRVPLADIRPAGHGRMRLRFQTLCRKAVCGHSGGDSMPTHGKILPVLRPGNLAADKTTAVNVGSLHPQYKIYPLTDGQTSRRIHWCFESYAAGSDLPVRWVEFKFKKPERVNMVTVWWESYPKKPGVQILDAGGKWVDVPVSATGTGSGNLPEKDNETGAVIQKAAAKLTKSQEKSHIPLPAGTVTAGVRVLELEKSGSLWVREIEIY